MCFSLYSYFVHEWDDLQDELILPQVVAMFEDDWVHGSILSLEDQLGWHQSTLTHTQTHTQDKKTQHEWWCTTLILVSVKTEQTESYRKSTETRAVHQWLEQILQSQRKCESHSWRLKMLCTLKSVAVSGTMPLILIWGSRGRGIGSISERFTFSLSASRACSRSVCRHRGRDTVNTTFPQWKPKTTCITCFTSKIQKQTFHNLKKKKNGLAGFCTQSNSVCTFFLRFPLSLCTAFISCTSLSTNVCWAANSERITLTLLSPWKEEDMCALKKKGRGTEWFSLLRNQIRPVIQTHITVK